MLVAGWTAAAGISLWYNITKLQDQARDSARIQAFTAFEKDVLYRRWNAGHGGVFVAVEDGRLRPNPYLPPEGRDITDAQGKTYTKVNPAFMTRLVHELGALSSGIRGHITSNNPIRRENAPDPWEKEALKQLERREASEVTGVVEMEGTPYLRYIGSLVTEESCLSCHASQGYKLGDVRGGISVSVPMLPFYHAMQSSARTLWLSHGALWLMGLLGISFGMNRLARRIGERDAAEMRLISLAQELEERVAERTMDLKAREQELRAFVDNVDAGVFLKETDGIYRFANVRFASMFKLGIDAIPGSSNADIFPPSLAAAIDSVESRVISDVHGAEYRHNQEGSPETGYNFFIFPLLGKGKNKEEDVAVGLGGLVVDMTDRDRAEKTLREARDAAERATEAKTRFLAKMSHEIRTPLNSIIGMAEILMRRVNAQEAYQEIREFVSIIQQSGMSLLAIINDILDFSKIESGSLQLNESGYSFASLLNDVINIASVQIVEHKTINFIARADVDIPHELLGDEVRVRQIFVNLLSNAVKYTSYGYIMLDVKLAERNGDEVTLDLTVKDTGIGIKEEDLKSIFSEFKRVDSMFNRRTEGTGLGLAIVQNLCRLMRGDVRVSSVYGSGSEFTATIRQKAGSTKKLASVVDAGQKRVLLLKGQEMRHKSVVSALKDLGLPEPKTAETLREFTEEFAGGLYDHAFIPSRYVREYTQACESLNPGTRPGTKLVIMADLGDIAALPGASCITMPIYCVPLANVLNGEGISESRVHDANGLPRFSAPAATVLVVDDVLTNLRVAREFMEYYDITVETCMDGAEALEMVEGRRYDLIFMDHMMPKMNGLEATLRIRQLGRDDEYFRNVPIVALTANAVVGQREIFLEHGFNDFLPKPIEVQALDAVLKKWLPPGKQQTIKGIARDARAAESVSQPGLAEGLDVEKGIKNVGGSQSAYAGILSVFRQDCETLMPRLLTTLADGDLSAYAIAAHALKSTLQTIGAEPLAFSAMLLENAASNGNAGFLQEKTQFFLDELQTLIGTLDLVLPGPGAREEARNGGVPAENGALPRKLGDLRKALISMNVRTVHDLLADCLGMELSPGQRTVVDEIDMLVKAFEFEKAVEKIREFTT